MREEANKFTGLHAATKSFAATKPCRISCRFDREASALPLFACLPSKLFIAGKRISCCVVGVHVAIFLEFGTFNLNDGANT
jgi:hypothetical protein